MAEITAAMVMKLRDETGLPMMECKKALQETNGDFELAKQKARESGKKIMAMRQDRSTDEGRLAAYATIKPPVGAMIELQVESAPVAKHEDVIALANDLAKQLATGPGAKTPEELWKQPAPSRKGMTLQQWKDELEGKMREVLRLTRIIRIDAPAGGFVHLAKIGVLVQVEGGNDELAKEIALHIAAQNPKATNIEDLDKSLVEKERAILTEQAEKGRQAREHHRQNDRRPDAQLLRRERAFGAAVRERRQANGRQSCRGRRHEAGKVYPLATRRRPAALPPREQFVDKPW